MSSSDRLTTTDEEGHRVYLYPEDVKGRWINRRQTFYAFLIFVFMILPWIHFQGKQVILLNIPDRNFVFFGHVFYGHDAPFLVFLLLIFILSMGLLTTMLGRAWCGWACPQTVFIHSIYGRIERWIEGSARKRQKRDAQGWTWQRFFLKLAKWIVFLLVSLHISHSFLGYFVGTRELLMISLGSPLEHLTLFFTMLFFTGIFLFDFGWFREQFCLIACPYGRFQSVMMDEHSLVVAYDPKRGEPRRAKGIEKNQEGDCVNCGHCVRVCPTGIDIRDGASQFECIACTQCIDACDEIMLRVGKPEGLIKYSSESEASGMKIQWLRARSLIYGLLLVLVLSVFAHFLEKHKDLDVVILRSQGAPFQVIDEGRAILNRFQLQFIHHDNEVLNIEIRLEDKREEITLVAQRLDLKLKSGQNNAQVFVRFSPSVLDQGNGKTKISIINKNNESKEMMIKELEVNLVGPF